MYVNNNTTPPQHTHTHTHTVMCLGFVRFNLKNINLLQDRLTIDIKFAGNKMDVFHLSLLFGHAVSFTADHVSSVLICL